MDTMLNALAEAAKKPTTDTWKAEVTRVLLTVALSLTFLGLSL
jgi:hypothetical protein